MCNLKSIATRTIKSLSVAGFLFAVTTPNVGLAQSGLSGAIDGRSVNFNNIQGGSSSSFFLDRGGSQQFFEEGRNRIYFLPEEESKPVLEIDETVEAEGIKYEDLQLRDTDDIEDKN